MAAGELAESIGLLFGGHRPPLQFPGSAGSLPAVFGSLAKHDFVGKLPTNAGKLPALPGQDRVARNVWF